MSKIKVAVVGAGILGSRHARVFNEQRESRLVAVVDVNGARAGRVAETHGVKAYTDLEAMLAQEEVDAVAVATPDHLHREPVLAAIRAGKHVFMEKPIATNLEDARAIAAASEESGRTVMVNFSQRFMPEFSWMKKAIERGEIGSPLMVVSSKFDTLYVPTRMINWAAHTSPLFFMTSHDLDLVHWYLGADPVEAVAHESRGVLEGRGVNTHDGVNALILFEGGISTSFHSSWIHPDTYPSISDGWMQVIGTGGVMTYRAAGREVEVYDKAGGRTIRFTGPGTATEVGGKIEGAFTSSVRYFLECILGGTEPMTSPRRTLATAEAKCAVLESLRTGQPVRIKGRL